MIDVAQLEHERARVQRVLQRRKGIAAPREVDPARMDATIDQILAVVNTVQRESSETVDEVTLLEQHSKVKELLEQYGNVSALSEVEKAIKKKIQVTKNTKKLEEAIEWENLLKSQPSVADLKHISIKLRDLPPRARDLLRKSVEEQVIARKDGLVDQLAELVKTSGWLGPKYDVSKTDAKTLKALANAFGDLIQLQAVIGRPVYPESWWGLQVLLAPFVDRFNFHFTTPNKDTNKLSKPEWALSFVETFLQEKLALVTLVVGSVFRKHRLIAEYEVITALLAPVRSKMEHMTTLINKKIAADTTGSDKYGRILSHLIFELSAFDLRIKTTYLYSPYIEDMQPPTKNWMGVCGDVLMNPERHVTERTENPVEEDQASLSSNTTVSNWLAFERELALKRFQSEIVAAKDAFVVDHDYQGDALKPTYSALNLVKLVDNLTTHLQTLGVVKYQLKYVSTVHLHLIDAYCDHVEAFYKLAFDAFTHSRVLKAIPGGLAGDAARQSEVDFGQVVLSFAQVYCLAKFVCNAVEQWSLELVFVQLWRFYCQLQNKDDSAHLSLFDNSVQQYQTLLTKAVSTLEQLLRKEIKSMLKDYANMSQWQLVAAAEPAEPSSLLALFVSKLPVHLHKLQRVMSLGDYQLLTDKIVSIYAQVVLEYIVTNNQFTRRGVEQLRADISYVTRQLDLQLYFSSANRDNTTYRKLMQCVAVFECVDAKEAKAWRLDPGAFKKTLEFDSECLGVNTIADLLARVI